MPGAASVREEPQMPLSDQVGAVALPGQQLRKLQARVGGQSAGKASAGTHDLDVRRKAVRLLRVDDAVLQTRVDLVPP